MAKKEYVKMKKTEKTPKTVVEILGINVEHKRVVEVPKADVKEFEKWGFEVVKETEKEEKERKKDK